MYVTYFIETKIVIYEDQKKRELQDTHYMIGNHMIKRIAQKRRVKSIYPSNKS